MSGLISVLCLALAALSGCPKQAPVAEPLVGWHQEGAKETPWRGDCYYPHAFEKLAETERRQARQAALEAMKQQWRGEKGEIVTFDPTVIDDVDTTLLGRPDRIESVARKNLEFCKQVMGAGASTDAWQEWLRNLSSNLTAGECNQPFDYQLIQYLEVVNSWQQPIHFCKGDRANITATSGDKYRISDDGPWINADGDTSIRATGNDWPCNIEGCYAGMLVGKFVTDMGVENIFPIGLGRSFEAPENGTLYWTINDTTFYDNKWHSSGTITDHTAVTVTPAE